MKLFLNILFAWLATIVLILLSVIWLMRIIQKENKSLKKGNFLYRANKYLRKTHISMGLFFIIVSYIHARFSSFSILSLNFGTMTLIVGVLICLTYYYRNNMGKTWIKRHRELTVLVLFLTVFHVVEVDGFVGFDKVKNSLIFDIRNLTTNKNFDTKKLKDGTYIGEGYGYSPGLKVYVEVKSGRIVGVSVLEHNEVGKMFYGPAFEIVPELIVESQSTDVDVVSGATMSSNGIKEAVNDAILKAK